MLHAEEDALADLLRRLDLEQRPSSDHPGDDWFVGYSPPAGNDRIFGGLVFAQAMRAGQATVEGREAHSAHGYFLRPGDPKQPIEYAVDRIRDGRSFTTRRVVAHQAGEAIFNMSASFVRPEEGMSHQRPMPEVGPPDGLEEWKTLRHRSLGLPEPEVFDDPIEVRVLDPSEFEDDRPRDPVRSVWLRTRGTLPEDPALHTAALVYATDRTLLGTAIKGVRGMPWRDFMGASLDHAVWLHHPIRFDDWLLYSSVSPIAHEARGLIFGALYRRDGTQVASVAQEALIRRPRRRSG